MPTKFAVDFWINQYQKPFAKTKPSIKTTFNAVQIDGKIIGCIILNL